MKHRLRLDLIGLCIAGFLPLAATAESIAVRHTLGSAHGFVEVTTLEGSRIGVGDVRQSVHGDVVTSRLTLNFLDGSLDDETTIFSQHGVFRLISDHHVQHGPSFPKPVDSTVDVRNHSVTSNDDQGRMITTHVDLPPDIANGLASTLLMNVAQPETETKIPIVIANPKPRIVHLSMKSAGEVTYTLAGTSRKATDFLVHVELGGVAGVVAPVIGKAPQDFHVWLVTGADPAFILEQGQLFEGGPVWRVLQTSPHHPEVNPGGAPAECLTCC